MREKHFMTKGRIAAMPFLLVVIVASIATAGGLAIMLLLAAGLFGYPLMSNRLSSNAS